MFKTKMLLGLVLALLVGGLLFFDLGQGVQGRLDLSKSANVKPLNNNVVVRQVPEPAPVIDNAAREAVLISNLRQFIATYKNNYLDKIVARSWVVTENTCLTIENQQLFAGFINTMNESAQVMVNTSASADRVGEITVAQLDDLSEAVFVQIRLAGEIQEILSLLSNDCLPNDLKNAAFPYGFDNHLNLNVVETLDQINRLP